MRVTATDEKILRKRRERNRAKRTAETKEKREIRLSKID